MNRQTPQRAAKQPLPIHWMKPNVFNIPIPRDEKLRQTALARREWFGQTTVVFFGRAPVSTEAFPTPKSRCSPRCWG
jgi:hypothetical protein